MTPLNGRIWKKSACFDSLSTGITNHMSTQTIPDLVSVVANELYIDISTAFVEVLDAHLKIMNCIMNISNLAGTAFINSTGGISKIPKSMDNDDRMAGIIYISVVTVIWMLPYRTVVSNRNLAMCNSV